MKLNSNGIVLRKESHLNSLLLVIDYDVDSTSLRRITKKKLLSKEQYLVEKARGAYITFIGQLQTLFNLF